MSAESVKARLNRVKAGGRKVQMRAATPTGPRAAKDTKPKEGDNGR